MTALGNGGCVPAASVAQQAVHAVVMNRSCQRHTDGFDTPARRITSAVPQPPRSPEDPGPPHVLLRAVAVRHDRREPRPIGPVTSISIPCASRQPTTGPAPREFFVRLIPVCDIFLLVLLARGGRMPAAAVDVAGFWSATGTAARHATRPRRHRALASTAPS